MLDVSRRAGWWLRARPGIDRRANGSGKELVAEALHRLSERAAAAVVTINCAADSRALLEAASYSATLAALSPEAVQGPSAG